MPFLIEYELYVYDKQHMTYLRLYCEYRLRIVPII
jgi:hypothetical protein